MSQNLVTIVPLYNVKIYAVTLYHFTMYYYTIYYSMSWHIIIACRVVSVCSVFVVSFLWLSPIQMFHERLLLTLVLMFLALSAYRSVFRVSSYDPLAGLAWAIITVRQLPPNESYRMKSIFIFNCSASNFSSPTDTKSSKQVLRTKQTIKNKIKNVKTVTEQ